MNSQTNQAILNYLNQNQLNPNERSTEDGSSSWVFDLAEGIQSELFSYEIEPGDLTAIMMTSVQIKASDNAITLAAAICPALAPATIVITGEVMTLRLMLRGNASSVAMLLEEGMMISRHIVAAVFTRIVELADGKIPMQNAMILAMQALQGQDPEGGDGEEQGEGQQAS